MTCTLVLFSSLATSALADEAAAQQAQSLQQAGNQQRAPHNPHPDAQWFPDAGLGLLFHWGMASVGATGDLSWGVLASKPWKDATLKPNTYYGWARKWKPDQTVEFEWGKVKTPSV